MAQVDDVAARIVDHFDTAITTMKLQKLCYMAQGWSLGLRGKPLFDADFQAWRHGPVCKPLFDQHKKMFVVDSWPSGDGSNLTRDERVIVRAILKQYDSFTGQELSELTHEPRTPWRVTRRRAGVRENESSSAVIPKKLIREFFEDELLAEY